MSKRDQVGSRLIEREMVGDAAALHMHNSLPMTESRTFLLLCSLSSKSGAQLPAIYDIRDSKGPFAPVADRPHL